jgi:nucleotide-binding universal stress UspA family protein
VESPKIVVGVDGSAGSRAALAWALAEAARRGAGVELVSAFPVTFYWTDAYLPDPDRIAAVRSDTEARARAMAQQACRDIGVEVPVEVTVVAGGAAAELVQRSEGAGLLVVGSRGRGPVRSTVLGSVALHCAAHGRCPVVVVHPPRDAARPAASVVVGVDDSEPSRLALRTGVAQAGRLGADVTAVVAYEPSNYWSDLYAVMAPPAGETGEHAQRRGERIVAEALGQAPGEAAGRGPRVRVVAEQGSPGEVLVRRSEGAALLVVGSRSRSQLQGMVLVSAALHCVVHASCPVMIVHPERSAATAPDTATAAAPARG